MTNKVPTLPGGIQREFLFLFHTGGTPTEAGTTAPGGAGNVGASRILTTDLEMARKELISELRKYGC
jgi:hypothetical protein